MAALLLLVAAAISMPLSAFASRASRVDLGTFANPGATSLGGLSQFGVFSRTYRPIGSDMEANIAAEMLYPCGSDIGASSAVKGLSGEHPLNYFVNVSDLSKFKYQRSGAEGNLSTYLVFGSNISLDKTPADRTLLTGSGESSGKGEALTKNTVNIADSSFKIDFDDAFKGLTGYAKAQHGKADQGVGVAKSYGGSIDQNNWVIEISCADGFDVVNLTKWELQNCKLRVKGSGSGSYSLVVNVSDASDDDDIVIGASKGMSIDGKGYDAYGAVGGKVLFNFGLSRGTYTFQKYQMGVVVAPNGTFVTDAYSHNGSIYASEVRNVNAELHQRPFAPQDFMIRKGYLTIRKVSEGAETPGSALFTVKGPGGYERSVRYDEFEDGAYVLDGLEPGDYEVSESGAEIDGYELEVDASSRTASVEAGGGSELTFRNVYTSIAPPAPDPDPDQPGNPGEPSDPDQPENPGDPSDLNTPATPDSPVVPEANKNAGTKKTQVKKSALPQTGDSNASGIALMATATVGAIAILVGISVRRHRDGDK